MLVLFSDTSIVPTKLQRRFDDYPKNRPVSKSLPADFLSPIPKDRLVMLTVMPLF